MQRGSQHGDITTSLPPGSLDTATIAEQYLKSTTAEETSDSNSPPLKKRPKLSKELEGVAGSNRSSDVDEDSAPSPAKLGTSVYDEYEIEKKRSASRASSRRTREREKDRMEHFQNTKFNLEQRNTQLREENNQLRYLINCIQREKGSHEARPVVDLSMLYNANATPSPSHVPLLDSYTTLLATAGILNQNPANAQHEAATLSSSHNIFSDLLINSISQGQVTGGFPTTTSAHSFPSQDAQALSLLRLSTAIPFASQVGPSGQASLPNNSLLSQIQDQLTRTYSRTTQDSLMPPTTSRLHGSLDQRLLQLLLESQRQSITGATLSQASQMSRAPWCNEEDASDR